VGRAGEMFFWAAMKRAMTEAGSFHSPSNRKGARHIDTREHFVDQLVKDHTIKLVQCRTNKMVADALTKNLPAPVFEQHRAVMLGEDEAPFTAMMCRV
jgi:hypothetical protein